MRVLLRSTCMIGMTMLLLSLAVSACAGPFEDGQAAAAAGDHAKAFELWRPLAKKGNVAAQDSLGVMYATGRGVKQDYKEAAKWFKKAAEQGDAMAQRELGLVYVKGQGEERNYEEAVRWLGMAAAQGDIEAQFRRGVMSCFREWKYSAAAEGDAEAQFSAGVRGFEDQGMKQDPAEALKWFRLAATQGHAESQCIVGCAYANGTEVARDEVEALKWLRLAAAQGHTGAPMKLARMYLGGQGVAPDSTEAEKLLRLAAAGGNARAAALLRGLTAKSAIVPGASLKSVLSALSLTDVISVPSMTDGLGLTNMIYDLLVEMGVRTKDPGEHSSFTGTALLDGYEIEFDAGLVVSSHIVPDGMGFMNVEFRPAYGRAIIGKDDPDYGKAIRWSSRVDILSGKRSVTFAKQSTFH